MKSKKPIKTPQLFNTPNTRSHTHVNILTRKQTRTSVEHGACVVHAFQCICNATRISCSGCRRRCCCSHRHWPNQFSNILISSDGYLCVCVQRLPLFLYIGVRVLVSTSYKVFIFMSVRIQCLHLRFIHHSNIFSVCLPRVYLCAPNN